MKKMLLLLSLLCIIISLVGCGGTGGAYQTTVYIDIVNNTGHDEILGKDVSDIEAVVRIDGKKVATLNIGDKAAIAVNLDEGGHKLKIGVKEISFEVTSTSSNEFCYKYLCNLLSYELQATSDKIVVGESDWIYVD